jgi:hypothetical protein
MSWTGSWVAADSKTISITTGAGAAIVKVTASPRPGGAPYLSAPLLDGDTKPIDRLPARYNLDERGRRNLEVEAGTEGIGPTYRLYPVVESPAGWCVALDNTPVEQVVLLPNTVIGLYDDYEDDVGVPWAYPLQPLRWQPRP